MSSVKTRLSQLVRSKENLTNETIQDLSETKPHACSCEDCRSMCRKQPCIGTPTDIEKLIKANLTKYLTESIWAVGDLVLGTGTINMVQIRANKDGSCPFYSEENRCALHKKGLKPLEGRLASHETYFSGPGNEIEDLLLSPPFLVAMSWISESNKEVIERINRAIGN